MSRTTSAVARHRKHKRLFKRAKGFWGDRKNHIRLTKDALLKALSFNYIHRKQKKRNFRCLWIVRINVAARMNGLSYSKLIQGLNKAGCKFNRKTLADLAATDGAAFRAIAEKAKTALAS